MRTLQDIFGVNQNYLHDAANARDLFDLFTPFNVSGSNNVATGNFELVVSGVILGRTNVVQSNGALGSPWLPLATNTLPVNSLSNYFRVTDPDAAGATNRFYRVLQLP